MDEVAGTEQSALPTTADARRRRDEAVAADDPATIGYAEVLLGASLFDDHQVALALDAFVRADEAYQRAGDDAAVVMTRLNQARTLSALGRDDECVGLYESIAAAHPPGPELGPAASALHGLAVHHVRSGDDERAEAAMRRLRETYVAADDRTRLAEHDYWVATGRFERGEYADAVSLLTEAARTFESLGLLTRVGDCGMYLGSAHDATSDAHQAVAAFERARAAYTEAGDPEAAGKAQANLDALQHRT